MLDHMDFYYKLGAVEAVNRREGSGHRPASALNFTSNGHWCVAQHL